MGRKEMIINEGGHSDSGAHPPEVGIILTFLEYRLIGRDDRLF